MRTIRILVSLGSIRFLLYSVAVVLLIASIGCGTPVRDGGTPDDAEADAEFSRLLEETFRSDLRPPPSDSAYAEFMEIIAVLDSLLRAEALANPDTTHHSGTAHGDTQYDVDFQRVEPYESPFSDLLSDFSISWGCGVGFYATGGQLSGDAHDRFTGMGLQFSIGRDTPMELGVRGYLADVRLGDHGPLTDGLKNEYELGAEMFFHYRLSPTSAFMSMYPAAGLRLERVYWSYTSPAPVGDPGDVEAVTSNELDSVSIYVALGAVFNQGNRWQPEVELQVGYRSFFNYTNNGVANDVFGDRGFVQIVVALIYLTEDTK